MEISSTPTPTPTPTPRFTDTPFYFQFIIVVMLYINPIWGLGIPVNNVKTKKLPENWLRRKLSIQASVKF